MPIIIKKNIQWKYSGSLLLFLLITGWDIRISARLSPLSPNGDQHQFSPNDIHTLSRDYVMRINKMIT